jgi:diguanylate cyclase (GGDEF)-like protein/PAS domain S-box-containing protein
VTPLVHAGAGPLSLARNLADRSGEAVLLAEAHGGLIHANTQARQLFGLDDAATGEQNLKVLVPGCPRQIRSDGRPRKWRARIPVSGGVDADMDACLFALDPPRCSVLALVASVRRRVGEHPDDEQLERWASAAQGSTDGFWHRPDVGLDESWWSPRLYQMLGYEPGELTATFSALVERLHPQDRERFLVERERDLLAGAPLDIEVRVRHRSGEYRHFRIRALVTRTAEGRPVSLSGSCQDVTELRRALEELQYNRERMRDLATAASDFFFETDAQLRITWVSENFEALTGADPTTLIDRDPEQGAPQGVPVQSWNRYREMLQRRKPFRDFIHQRMHRDGHTLYISLNAHPMFDAYGEFAGFRACGSDVTERVHIENALRESEEKYRTIVEADHDAVLVVDATDQRILDANGAAGRLYGLQPDDLMRTEAAALSGDPRQTRRFLERVHESGAPQQCSARHRNASGDEFPVEISASLVRLSGRDAIVCMVRDVSMREEALHALEQSEARLKALVDNSPFEIFLKGQDGRYVLANPTVTRSWERPLEQILGRRATDVFDAEQATRFESEDAEVLARNEPISFESPAAQNATERDLLRVKFPIRDGTGEPTGVGAIVLDLAERNRTLAALEESERRFRDFAELAADYLWEVDAEMRYTFVSERCLELNGIPPHEMLGRRVNELFENQCDDPEMLAAHVENMRLHRPTAVEYTRTRPDGAARRVYLHARPRFDDDGSFTGYRGITRDITEGHEMSVRLAYQATHDALTGLVNRTEFERRLGMLLESARTEGSSHALCYLDLDQFKVVNDTCGHVAGDALLERLAETLTFRVRQRDTIARLGGDEFGVLIEHCSVDQASRVASVLHQALSEFVFTWEGKPFQVGASFGLVPITPDLGDAADVLAAADSACYVAKDQGRNRIHIYSKDDAELSRRRGEMGWVSQISGALAEHRFRLRAQPVVPLHPRHAGAHHCELLLVMLDSEGKEVMPGAFLPAAERYNLATRIDRWVVNAALSWLTEDSDGRGRPALCGINLSAHSLGEDDFLNFVRSECARYAIPASRLCFEITETAAIANLDLARQFMSALKSDGAMFALDDFGKGLSSFGYLRELPVDYIKIDAQFVRNVLHDPIDLAMVRSINEVARLMEKRTIAEGVEAHDTLRKLREVGVDYAQGYAIGAPRYVDER